MNNAAIAHGARIKPRISFSAARTPSSLDRQGGSVSGQLDHHHCALVLLRDEHDLAVGWPTGRRRPRNAERRLPLSGRSPGSYASSAFQVVVPAIPSATSLCFFWKSFTAVSVAVPNTPSSTTGLYPYWNLS